MLSIFDGTLSIPISLICEWQHYLSVSGLLILDWHKLCPDDNLLRVSTQPVIRMVLLAKAALLHYLTCFRLATPIFSLSSLLLRSSIVDQPSWCVGASYIAALYERRLTY